MSLFVFLNKRGPLTKKIGNNLHTILGFVNFFWELWKTIHIYDFFLFFTDVEMAGLENLATNAWNIQDANMVHAMSLGLVIAKKAGVVFFATKIWIIVPITPPHVKMEPLASILDKDLTLVLVLQDGLVKIAKSESPTSVLTTFVSMVELVR